MAKIDEKNLEKAFSSKKENSGMSAQEEVGFHKGALSTLMAERTELVKMIGNVEAIMQMHIKRLEELGVKIDYGGNNGKK